MRVKNCSVCCFTCSTFRKFLTFIRIVLLQNTLCGMQEYSLRLAYLSESSLDFFCRFPTPLKVLGGYLYSLCFCERLIRIFATSYKPVNSLSYLSDQALIIYRIYACEVRIFCLPILSLIKTLILGPNHMFN